MLAIQYQHERSSAIQNLEKSLAIYNPKNDYDSFFSQEIYTPLVNEVLDLCKEAECAPKLPVIFSHSPGISPSAAALPSSGTHILFAGTGTFSFCNYWAKIFTTLLFDVINLPKAKRKGKHLKNFIKCHDSLNQTLSLVLRYAITRSLVGYGRLNQKEEFHGTRAELTTAMEVFVIGHELAHFSHYEQFPDTDGIPPGSTSKDLEIACDVVGLCMTTAYGSNHRNIYAYQLLAPILLFSALNICERARSYILKTPLEESGSHPTNDERIALVMVVAEQLKVSTAIQKSIQFTLKIANLLEETALERITEFIDLRTDLV